MNQASALGPPRMGRVVKTEKEALEEIAQAEPETELVADDCTITPTPTGLDPGSSKVTVERIVIDKATQSFTLYGLETPAGRWKELTYRVSDIHLNYQQWVDISLGKSSIRQGKFIKDEQPFTEPNSLASMKAIYWAMAATDHQAHTTNGRPRAAAFGARNILERALRSSGNSGVGPGVYLANEVYYEPASTNLKFVTNGHTTNAHLYSEDINIKLYNFSRSIQVPLRSSPLGQTAKDDSSFPQSICKALLDEWDIDAIIKTIQWVYRTFQTPSLSLADTLGQPCKFTCGFSTDQSGSLGLNLAGSYDIPKPAIILYYTHSDCIPRGLA